MATLLLAVGLTAWVLLRDPHRYSVTAHLVSAGSIVKGDQVRQGAAVVGTVSRVGLTNDGQAELRLTLKDVAAPLPLGTVATIRLDGLAGVANRYVALDRPLVHRGDIPDGGSIPAQDTQAPVDFDAVFDALDPATRSGLRALAHGGAQQTAGNVAAARASLERLAPALSGLDGVSRALAGDQPALRRLLVRGAAATGALAARGAELTDVVAQTGRTADALAAQQAALRAALRRLPPVLAHGTRTLGTLRAALDDLDPLVTASGRAAPILPAFLARLRAVVSGGAAPLGALAGALSTPGAANDLTDALAAAPALDRLARGAFPRAIRTLDAGEPELTALRAYTPDVVAALTRTGQTAANYDANGHYVRVQPDLVPFRYDAGSGTLEDSDNGFTELQSGQGDRCPGGLLTGVVPLVVPGCSLTATPGAG